MTTTERIELVVDRTICAGHGMCYGTAPNLIDCDEHGDPILPDGALTPGDLESAQKAAVACPERALSLNTSPPDKEYT